MDKEIELSRKQSEFFDLLKKTYEKGISDEEMTLEKMIEDLKVDIRKVFAR